LQNSPNTFDGRHEMMEKPEWKVPFFNYLMLSLIFTLGLSVFEFVLFSKYYEDFALIRHFQSYEFIKPLKTIILGLSSFLLSVFFVLTALISPYRYRIVYFSLFCLGVWAEYGYQEAFNRFTNSEDAANALFAADSRIMFNTVSYYIEYFSITPCFAFALLLIFVKPIREKGLKNFLAVILIFSGFFSLTAYVSTSTFPSVSFNAFYRTVIGFPIKWFVGSLNQSALIVFYNTPRQKVEFQSQSEPKNNIVFIVDESVRGDHLSLNGYERQTTPFLEQLNQKGLIVNWGPSVSGTTCSINSNNLLLTGVSELPDIEGHIYQYPTVFQYAKAMGYKTFYFDGQLSYRWLGKSTDVKDFDQWITPPDLQQDNWHEIDAAIARRVKAIVGGSTGNFIWINKFGAHAPYYPSYPESETKWMPVRQRNDKYALFRTGGGQEELTNDYDNAVLYNTQSFFTNLLDDGLAENTFYVYTSDHGQNLGETGKTLSHCSNGKNEANVPLFIVADSSSLPDVDTGYKASHSNIFPTILDLMNYPENERRQKYALSLLKTKAADSKPRFYFEGNLHSRFSNGKYLFD
jgi:glucan phosphoethanolaminetransferase (alkaline phosphatase superfamily)